MALPEHKQKLLKEKFVIAVDIGEEMGKKDAEGSPTQMDKVRAAVRSLCINKKKLFPSTSFSLAVVTDMVFPVGDFNGDALEMLKELESNDCFSSFQPQSPLLLTSVYAFVNDQIASLAADEIFHLVLIYGRDTTPPISCTDVSAMHSVISHPRVFIDVMFLHEKVTPQSNAQAIYDALMELHPSRGIERMQQLEAASLRTSNTGESGSDSEGTTGAGQPGDRLRLRVPAKNSFVFETSKKAYRSFAVLFSRFLCHPLQRQPQDLHFAKVGQS